MNSITLSETLNHESTALRVQRLQYEVPVNRFLMCDAMLHITGLYWIKG